MADRWGGAPRLRRRREGRPLAALVPLYGPGPHPALLRLVVVEVGVEVVRVLPIEAHRVTVLEPIFPLTL